MKYEEILKHAAELSNKDIHDLCKELTTLADERERVERARRVNEYVQQIEDAISKIQDLRVSVNILNMNEPDNYCTIKPEHDFDICTF